MTSRERADHEVELHAREKSREARDPSSRALGVPLNLSISRDGVGIALTEPLRVGPIEITRLETVLPNVRFPLDVSGGVAPFLSKRGKLSSLALETDARLLETWLPSVLAGILTPEAPRVSVELRAGIVSIVVATHSSLSRSAAEDARMTARARAVIAWDVVPVTDNAGLTLYVSRARGVHLPEPAILLATRMMATALGSNAKREGARFLIESVCDRVAMHLFPIAGARVPDGRGMIVRTLRVTSTAILLDAERARAPESALDETASVLAHESWLLAREGDDALIGGRVDDARAAYLRSLERAPLHAELVTRIANVDRLAGGRDEAALAILGATLGTALERAETLRNMINAGGPTTAQTGSASAEARAAFLAAAENEPTPLLSGAAYAEAARLCDRAEDALTWLDMAVARAPADVALRVARLEKSLTSGRLESARADVEHLVVASPPGAARYRTLMDIGDAYRTAGFPNEAATHYERALVQAPEAPLARAHLGETFIAMGRYARGAALLASVLEREESLGENDRAVAMLTLARALGDGLNQRSVALARLRGIRTDAVVASDAFELEANYRTTLGDLAGASMAYTRMREAIAATPPSDAVAKLCRAAAFETKTIGHRATAERHLALALRLAPDDDTARALYRELAPAMASAVAPIPPDAVVAGPPPAPEPSIAASAPEPVAAAATSAAAEVLDDTDAEIRVEELTQKLHANPKDEKTVDELLRLLAQLKKFHERFALISAQLEDPPAHRVGDWTAAKNDTLHALAEQSRAEGRNEEAELFESMM